MGRGRAPYQPFVLFSLLAIYGIYSTFSYLNLENIGFDLLLCLKAATASRLTKYGLLQQCFPKTSLHTFTLLFACLNGSQHLFLGTTINIFILFEMLQ